MRAVKRSCPRPLAFCLLSWQRCKRCKSGLWSSLSDENAAKRECGYFCTTSITESGPLYKQRIAICHIKEVTAILWHLLPIPQWIRMLISLFGHTLKQVTNMLFFAYYLHLSDIIIYKQRFLTPGHQGWNDLHSLCRIGMEYYLLNNDDNDIIYWIMMIIMIMMMIIIMIIMMTMMIIGTATIMIMIIIITTTLTMTIMKMIMIKTAQTPCQSLYKDRRI